jgi:hypothetical protein
LKLGGVVRITKADRILTLAFLLPASGALVYSFLNAEPTFIYIGWALIILWYIVVLSRAVAKVAQEKGRSYSDFLILSLVFSPIIMGIVAAAISPLPGSKRYIPMVVQSAGPVASSELEQIEKLGELLAKGLITQVEFDEKRAKLLDRI